MRNLILYIKLFFAKSITSWDINYSSLVAVKTKKKWVDGVIWVVGWETHSLRFGEDRKALPSEAIEAIVRDVKKGFVVRNKHFYVSNAVGGG